MTLSFIADSGYSLLGSAVKSLFQEKKLPLSFKTKMTYEDILNVINHSEGTKRQPLKM